MSRSLRWLLVLLLSTGVALAPRGAAFGAPITFGSSLRESIEYLKTRGLLPLWAGAARPLSPRRVASDVAVARRRAAGLPLSPRELDALDDLAGAAKAQLALLASGYGHMGLSTVWAEWVGGSSQTRMALGLQAWPGRVDVRSAYLTVPIGSVDLWAGRVPVGWGPSPDAGLVLSEYSGGLDQVQISFEPFSWMRFAKLVAFLDGGRSLAAMRADVLVGDFRIGFTEAVLMRGAPFWAYVVNPIPVSVGYEINARARNWRDNYMAGLELEWRLQPGLRLYLEYLADDLTTPFPGFGPGRPPSRVGATLGLHGTELLAGRDVRLQYTRVQNWTYASVDGLHWLHNGLPTGHPLGSDFELWHLRLSPGGMTGPPDLWVSYLRKGEGRPDRFWSSIDEAERDFFLSGMVEDSLIVGVEFRGSSGRWTYSVGPWLAYRWNSGHIPGATRLDWGMNLAAQIRF